MYDKSDILGLSSCFILLGSCLLYLNFGITNLDGIYVLSSLSEINGLEALVETNQYFNLALLIMSVGYLFKVSAAPFHFWSPEVYDGIPTIVTTFVAIIPKISIFIFLLELVHYTSESMLEFNWTSLLLVSSLLSLIIGSVVGLIQHRIKRLLAYSAISTTGFLLLALSINSIESIQSFLFYLLQYSLSNLNVFFILILIGYYLLEIDRNSDRRLLDKNNSPALGCGKPLLLWDLLPNSGDSLKLLVPSYSRKIISGWSNHSCMVINQKISEKYMGYRGSKSIVFLDFCVAENIIVKEQRVYGNRCIKFIHLRCTLMGFERNYQIKILSKQINKVIYYTSLAVNASILN